ncbi:MAG: response regulator transcription factor, partial [Planktomarina sp.]
AAQATGLGLYGTQFLVSVFGTQTQVSWMFHEVAQLAAFLALVLGTVLSAVLLASSFRRQEKLEYQVDAARKRFQDILHKQFADWDLTEAETEIGMLMIKGLSIAEIAELRGRSQATVKAQNSAIYQKSGMANRAQLVSYFVEDLTSGI